MYICSCILYNVPFTCTSIQIGPVKVIESPHFWAAFAIPVCRHSYSISDGMRGRDIFRKRAKQRVTSNKLFWRQCDTIPGIHVCVFTDFLSTSTTLITLSFEFLFFLSGCLIFESIGNNLLRVTLV